ncbi:MAG: prohibitin family protein [Gammaproteobacteria bacterium]|nr:prohibitin family protein [Gammaproteobacteria bacterium]
MSRYLPVVITSTIIFLLVLVYFHSYIFITIQSGEAGVLYRRFAGGTVTDRIYGEGLHIIFPWNTMSIYNTRVQEKSYSLSVLTDEGLKIKLHVSIRYYPERDSVGVLHQKVGPDYLQKVVIPEVDHTLRVSVGNMNINEVYTSAGASFHEIIAQAVTEIEKNFIVIQDVIVRQVDLPDTVEAAIQAKIEQKQLAEAYEFRLARETQEAKRKAIEAKGIFDYNVKVKESLTGDILKWKGIQATQALSESNNAKVVVIGNGDNQLPIILGGASGP